MLLWSEIVLVITYVFQIAIVLCLPVPSPVSLDRNLLVSKKSVSLDFSQAHSATRLLSNYILALIALIGALVPAVTLLFPTVYKYCVPFFPTTPILPESLLIGLLLGGNITVFSAVLTIRKNTGFNTLGESHKLISTGIFGCVQHPMITGLGMIYLAIISMTPCLITAVGIGAFYYHLKHQILLEEKLLLLRFGKSYSLYQKKVGRFLPRIFQTKKET